MKGMSYQEFKEMEDYHSTGSLFKFCKRCGKVYQPVLKVYKKKSMKIGSKLQIKVVGNWINPICNECIEIAEKDRREYKKELISKIKENKE